LPARAGAKFVLVGLFNISKNFIDFILRRNTSKKITFFTEKVAIWA
jgi:hypothetical protein